MHGNLAGPANASTTSAVTSDSKNSIGVKDDGAWFSEVAKALLPKIKAGHALHVTSGLADERLCQKYVADDVRPSAYFLRRLLRTPGGWQWLSGAMDGCQEEWWLEMQEARDVYLYAKHRRAAAAETLIPTNTR